MPQTASPEEIEGGPAALVQIGVVGKAHGLRGAFLVAARSDRIPTGYSPLWLRTPDLQYIRVQVRESRVQGGRPVLLTDLAASRDEIESFAGSPLFVTRRQITEESEGQVIWADLPGLTILDEGGTVVGVVRSVSNTGSADFIEVARDDGMVAGIPLVPDYFGPMPLRVMEQEGCRYLRLSVPASVFDEIWEKDRP